MLPVPVTRTPVRFLPDASRVITKPFVPTGDVSPRGETRVDRILSRVLSMTEAAVSLGLGETERRFAGRHGDLRRVFEDHFDLVSHRLESPRSISADRRLLIGAYFSHEYSIESAALSNPSIVAAPDQTGLVPGAVRFIMSLRAIGEGHISSIQFRSGVIDGEGHIDIEPATNRATTARRHVPTFERPLFRRKLAELASLNEVADEVLSGLPDRFTLEALEQQLRLIEKLHGHAQDVLQATRKIHWLASSNYESTFEPTSQLSERVLFPAGPTESHGMEDARFVRFQEDDGSVQYFAPYTAYDGFQIMPQLIETADFQHFAIATLNGPCARNKGIALFPRRIGGSLAALGRLDNENNYLMWSDNVRFWDRSEILQRPRSPWEFVQIGNCGSPIETEAGWLVITHGVGALRQYAIGAILLDLADPARVIGHLDTPLLEPDEGERDGYVPNVVYSCGSMVAGDLLVLPYGFSDVGTKIATVRLDSLLEALTTSVH